MGPVEDSTRAAEDQKRGRRQCPSRWPRTRRCLLKGCEQRFHPRRARERYCSEECRKAARAWSGWKAQQSYRETAAGKKKRNGQSRRYRERVKNREQPEPENAVPETARVITKDFFRPLLRPPRLLRRIRAPAPVAAAAVLLGRVPARHGTGLAARETLALCTGPRLRHSRETQPQLSPTY